MSKNGSTAHNKLLLVEQMPLWSRVQDNEWDRASRFIYRARDLDDLRSQTRRVAAAEGLPLRDFASYVLRRWYNYQTHHAVLDIILAHGRTCPEPDPFHHTVDFYLDGVGFDLKMTALPQRYGRDLAYARAHPEHLAHWLYENQSVQGRYHAANRLFVVLHDAADPERTWELRRDHDRLAHALSAFLDQPRLLRVELPDGDVDRRPLAGVVYCVRE